MVNLDLTCCSEFIEDEAIKKCNITPVPNDSKYRELARDFYFQCKKEDDDYFHEWFNELHGEFLQEAEKFVSLALDDKSPYASFNSERIHQATFVLRFDLNDHQAIINSIDNRLDKCFKGLDIVRLKQSLSKKKELVELFCEIKESKRLLVIVEQTETLVNSCLQNDLIKLLYGMLDEEQDRRILVMFCMSSSSLNITQAFTIDSRRIMKNYGTITGSTMTETAKSIESKFLKDDRIFHFGPEVIQFIHGNYVLYNASFCHFRYLYQQAVLLQLSRPVSLIHLPKKQLVSVLKSSPYLIESIRSLESMKKYGTKINWRDTCSIANFCKDSLAKLQTYHEFCMRQLECYFTLMEDPAGIEFPSALQELYMNLIYNDSLGNSEELLKAFYRFGKSSREVLLGRIRKTLQLRKSEQIEKLEDVRDILENFEARLENNDNQDKISNELIRALSKHSEKLISPLKLPLNEAYYFDDLKQLKERTLLLTRKYFHRGTGREDAMSILYELVMQSTETINSKDLYEEFAEKMKDVDGHFIKPTFIDLIETMEHQGLLRADRKGILIRCEWP